MVFGFALAWTWCATNSRPKLVDAIIDMPFALPTAVSGIALATIFSVNGWIGQYLEPQASSWRTRRSASRWRSR
jgi:sulfate transport system permease protein